MKNEVDFSEILNEHDIEKAAITIQKHLRGLKARKQYGITHLEKGYALVPMASLPEQNKERAGHNKIYLSNEGYYIVRGLDGTVHAGQLENFDEIKLASNFTSYFSYKITTMIIEMLRKKHLISLGGNYSLALMSSLPEQNKEYKTVYLSTDGQYILNDCKHGTFKGRVKDYDFRKLEINFDDPEFNEELRDALSEVGHISEKSRLTEEYKTFVVGNDPLIPPLDEFHFVNEKIALIATSGMRAVSIAAELGDPANTPKIILIDNSRQVYEFWYAMREFIKDDDQSGSAELFLQNLPSFLLRNKDFYRDIKDSDQDINIFFDKLIKKYGYDYIRAIILHTSLIKQSWADQSTFIKIKNILELLKIDKIYMYPSNIVCCINDKNIQNQVLKNIEEMNPVLSIHTNKSKDTGKPNKVYFFKNQTPNTVLASLFSSAEVVNSLSNVNDSKLSLPKTVRKKQ